MQQLENGTYVSNLFSNGAVKKMNEAYKLAITLIKSEKTIKHSKLKKLLRTKYDHLYTEIVLESVLHDLDDEHIIITPITKDYVYIYDGG